MPVKIPHVDWLTVAPEGILFTGALVLLVVHVLAGRRLPRTFWTATTVLTAGFALWPSYLLWHRAHRGHTRFAIDSALVVDGFSVFFFVMVVAAVILAALVADGYLRREDLD